MSTWRIQGMRFVVVGLMSNLVLYLLYLLLTTISVGHKTAMTLVYILGVLQTFMFNRRWTFEHRGGLGPGLLRYFTVYGAGYLINLAALAILVDLLGWPHAIVQAAAILTLAVALFLAQKYWVFNQV